MKTRADIPALNLDSPSVFNEQPTIKEKRVYPRHELLAEVTFASDHNFFTGLTRDMSKGGLFLATPHLLPVGELINVIFTLPDSPDRFEAEAEVKWVRDTSATPDLALPPGMGLEFLELSQHARATIAEFLLLRESMLVESNDQ